MFMAQLYLSIKVRFIITPKTKQRIVLLFNILHLQYHVLFVLYSLHLVLFAVFALLFNRVDTSHLSKHSSMQIGT